MSETETKKRRGGPRRALGIPRALGAFGAVAAALSVSCASTDGRNEPADGRNHEVVTFTIENDTVTGTDNNYTNGIGIAWRGVDVDRADPDSWYRRWLGVWEFLPFIGDPGCSTHAAFALSQQLFTPDDISLVDPPRDDQPYAGLLLFDTSLVARSARVTHAYTVRLGVVGPSSFGDQLQAEYHEFIGADRPRGWDTQLPDEPVANLDYTIGYELVEIGDGGGLQSRLVPVAGAGVGTYFVGASAGLFGELGWNLPNSVAVLSARRGLSPSAQAGVGTDPWSLRLFAGSGGFAVAHYLPLDGTVTRTSRSVSSEPLVGFVSAGVGASWNRWRLDYYFTFFSDTFETQRTSTDFGTLSISYSF